MGYADLAAVRAQLNLSTDSPADASAIARLAQLDDSMSALFEIKCNGRRFGGAAVATARTVPGTGTDRLWLDVPLTSLTSVVVVDVPPITVDPTTLILLEPIYRGTGFRAIRRTNVAIFPATLNATVTGVWTDQPPGGSVPPEVRDTVTYAVIDQYRNEVASPAGVIGPDGFATVRANPWNFELAKNTIAWWTLPPRIAV